MWCDKMKSEEGINMKNMRIPLLIALGVAIIGIIFGSFFDLQISTAIASPTHAFGLTVSAIGPTIGFCGVAIIAGGFIALALKGQYHIGLKILFFIMAGACMFVSIYYPGGEYFGINGFYWVAPEWVGYLIPILPAIGSAIGGYFLFKDCKNKNMWIVFLIICLILTLTLVPAIQILKGIAHRPRYRFLMDHDDVVFHNWWEPFKEYNDYITAHTTIPHDHFKYYQSGHTAEASILIVPVTFLPLAHYKFKKAQMPLFIGSCCLILLVALARILAAAHFLSDVSTGATIMILLTVIANEVVMRIKPLQLEEQGQ